MTARPGRSGAPGRHQVGQHTRGRRRTVHIRALGGATSIVYRRLTMEIVDVIVPLERATAAEYASWFKALADGTRVQLVSLLARAGRPMRVGEIVAAVP